MYGLKTNLTLFNKYDERKKNRMLYTSSKENYFVF